MTMAAGQESGRARRVAGVGTGALLALIDGLAAVAICFAWLGPDCLESRRQQLLVGSCALALVWLGSAWPERGRSQRWIEFTCGWLVAPALILALQLPISRWLALGLASSIVAWAAFVLPFLHRSLARAPLWGRTAALLGLTALVLGLGPARHEVIHRLRARSPPPHAANILLITIDTTRTDALGCYGQPWPTSPHMDRLANEGARFERAISQSPHTHGSLGTILTSTYPIEHRSIRWHERLDERNATLAEHLTLNGYRTAAFLDNPWLTREQGFAQGYRDFSEVAPTEEIVAWLEQARGTPFFLHVHVMQPHAPYDAIEPWASEFSPDYPAGGKYSQGVPIEVLWDAKQHAEVSIEPEDLRRMRALYASEVRQMDEQIGRILAQLESAGLAASTLVAVVADHGEEFLEHGNLGHAETLYDELVHVPLLLRFPGRIAPQTLVSEQMQLLDLAPTLLDLAGVDPLPSARGFSWSGRLARGEAAPASAELAISQVYRVRGRHLLAASTSTWKLHVMVTPIGPDHDDDWQLFGPAASDFLAGNRYQLFDLQQDPGETVDVAEAHPDTVADLLGRLESWRARSQLRSP